LKEYVDAIEMFEDGIRQLATSPRFWTLDCPMNDFALEI
jgi:hypothetical protein